MMILGGWEGSFSHRCTYMFAKKPSVTHALTHTEDRLRSFLQKGSTAAKYWSGLLMCTAITVKAAQKHLKDMMKIHLVFNHHQTQNVGEKKVSKVSDWLHLRVATWLCLFFCRPGNIGETVRANALHPK